MRRSDHHRQSVIADTFIANIDEAMNHYEVRATSREESGSASIVTGVDAPPVLQPAERVFDLMPLAREDAVMFNRLLRGWTSMGCRP